MNIAGALTLGFSVPFVTTSAFGRQLNPVDAGTSHRSAASCASGPGDGQSRWLFKIGGLPVHVDGLVQPPNKAVTKRNLAADPL
jgi:hypothetical protein